MKKTLIIIILLIFSLIIVSPVSAQLVDTNGLSEISEDVRKSANLGTTTLEIVIANVIKTVLGLLSIVFLILILSAGIRWMTAEGNEEQVAKARKTLKTAIIGLIIVLAAYAITYFIFANLPFSGGEVGGVGGT